MVLHIEFDLGGGEASFLHDSADAGIVQDGNDAWAGPGPA